MSRGWNNWRRTLAHAPAEEVDVEEDVLAVVEAEFRRLDHDLAHRVGRGTQDDDCNRRYKNLKDSLQHNSVGFVPEQNKVKRIYR